MKTYELTYLISSELLEEEVKQFQNKIISLIQEGGGVLGEENTILRKKLAYPIKKQGQAYLAVSNFQIEPEKLASLEKKLKLEKHILRFLILTKKPIKEMPVRLRRRPKFEVARPVLPKEKKKVELKEIEEKLEEILKQ